jgi:sortase A
MPERGPVQLLLFFFRSRAKLGWGIGGALGIAALLGLFQAGEDVYVNAKAGVAQLVRQSAWEHALAGEPKPSPWPWDEASPATNSTVPRLGLSAVALKEPSGQGLFLGSLRKAMLTDQRDPHLDLGDVAIGDRITVTTADGESHMYKVTGRRVVDQPQAESDADPTEVSVPLVTCTPLDPFVAGALRLIIEAVHADPGAPPAPSLEQKL